MAVKQSVDQMIIKARSHANNGDVLEAQKLYQAILQTKKEMIQKEFAALKNPSQNSNLSSPPQESLNQLADLYNQGEFQAVIKQALSLIEQYPQSFVVWNILGAAATQTGMLDQAVNAYKKAILIKPDYVDAHYNMGIALQDLGDYEKSIKAYKKAISLKPDYADAYCNMGISLHDLGDYNKSVEAYKKAIFFQPDYAQAFNNMGLTFEVQGKLDEAKEAFEKAITLKPDFADAYANMGNIFKDQGKLDLALDAFKQSLDINPKNEGVRVSKLNVQASICDWTGIQQDQKLIPKLGVSEQHVLPFNIMTFEDSPERNRIRSELYAKNTFTHKPIPISSDPIKKHKRLRVGYFSSDFRMHSLAFIMANIIEAHDKNNFEIYGYSFGPNDSSNLRNKIINSCDVFREVKEVRDKDIALLARQDKLDIAIDLNGYTVLSRPGIFIYRAAPIQMHFFGTTNSCGTDFIDYYISDNIGIPKEHENHFNETIIRLPYWAQASYENNYISDQLITRKDMGLPENGFVFCNFNNNYKLSPIEFDIWMRLLNKVDNSVLWLFKSNKWVEKNLQQEAQKRGVDPNRLVFAEKVPHPIHLARQKLGDVFVDSFNVNAGVTAGDALWAGLPLVTKLGKGQAARTGGMVLASIDMPELITKTEQEYENLLLDLATNPERLSVIKEKLRKNRLSTPLFNLKLFTKHLENGYQQAYQQYIDRKKPQPISVPVIEI